MKKILTLIFLLIPLITFSQPGGGGDPPDTPLGGIEYMIIAGCMLGGIYIYKRRKNKYDSNK